MATDGTSEPTGGKPSIKISEPSLADGSAREQAGHQPPQRPSFHGRFAFVQKIRGTGDSQPLSDIEQGLRDTDHGHAADEKIVMREGLSPRDRPSSAVVQSKFRATLGPRES